MSDAKAAETKPEGTPPDAKAVLEAKPAEVKPVAAKPAEAKPAAAVKAPEAKPAAPELPKAGTVGVRAPAPKAPEPSVNITITAKAAIMIMSGLVTIVLLLGATTVFLLVRMTDKNGLARVTWQGPGQEGPGFGVKPGTGAPAGGHGAAVAPDVEKEKPSNKTESPENVEIGINFKDSLGGKPGGPAGSWPWFRGAKYDNTVTGVPLANKWPASGPPVKWTLKLGEGYSGPAVHGGRIYIQDYDSKTNEESLRCFSMEDGIRTGIPLSVR